MKPYTITGECNDEESLRSNWRGNRCSKVRNGTKGAKGDMKEFIGNSNYHRKKADRANKKSYRQRIKREMLIE